MTIIQILLGDTSISANWVMAGLLAVLLIVMKRSSEAADRREKKIDEILEKQQIQLNNHEILLNVHREKIEKLGSEISDSNHSLVDQILTKIRAATSKHKEE